MSANAFGRLILAATPLGNPADASPRLRELLESAQIIAAEDTRRLRRLAAALGVSITGRVLSFYDANERSRLSTLIDALVSGDDVAVVTDAGMPSVSDPGYRLVSAAIDADITVTALPGPSAVTAALAVSGLPCDRFCFEGFPPRKAGERRRYFAELASERRTLVFFESPRRLAACLADLANTFGIDRQAAVCRELTKTYEEVRRGSLSELAEWATSGVRGEITLVVAGADLIPGESPSSHVLAAAVAELESGGSSRRRDAIASIAQRFGVTKRTVFNALIETKGTTARMFS